MIIKVLILIVVGMIFFYMLGKACIPSAIKENEDKIFINLISPILGVAVWGISTLFIGSLGLYNVLLIWIIFILSLMLIIVRRKYLNIDISRDFGWVILPTILLVPFFIYPIMPIMIDGGMYFGNGVNDHVKVALVNMISNFGLPPLSPFISTNGIPDQVIYYYGWHAITAQFEMLTGVSAYVADVAMTGISGILTFFVISAFAYKFTLSKWAIPVSGVLLVCFEAINILLPKGVIDFLDANNSILGFFSVISSITWTPQHITSSCFIPVIIWLCWKILKTEGHINFTLWIVLCSLICTACFMSIYAGLFALILVLISLIVVFATHKDVRTKIIQYKWFWIGTFIVSVAICSNYLLYLTASSKEAFPLIFGLIPVYGESVGFIDAIKTFFYFYCIYLPWRWGMAYIIIIYFIFKRRFLSSQYQLLELMIRLFCLLTLIAIFTVHSSYYTNDFGWRISGALCIFMVIIATVLITHICKHISESTNIKARLINLVVLIVILIPFGCAIPDAYYKLTYRCTKNPHSHVIFAKALPGWEDIKRLTKENELVLSNPQGFQSLLDPFFLGGYVANIFHALYSDRPTPISDYIMAKCYSLQVPAKEVATRYERITKFFNGNADDREVRYVAKDLHTKALLITPLDGLWLHSGEINKYYDLKINTPDYRVYIKK